jgi:hypothetical protein
MMKNAQQARKQEVLAILSENPKEGQNLFQRPRMEELPNPHRYRPQADVWGLFLHEFQIFLGQANRGVAG